MNFSLKLQINKHLKMIKANISIGDVISIDLNGNNWKLVTDDIITEGNILNRIKEKNINNIKKNISKINTDLKIENTKEYRDQKIRFTGKKLPTNDNFLVWLIIALITFGC